MNNDNHSYTIQVIESDPDRKEHMDKLADAFFEYLERNDYCEYGGWGLDDKRPFGNSCVEPDIAEIIGWDRGSVYENENGYWDKDRRDYLNGLYDDLGAYLKYKWKIMKDGKP